MVQVFHAPLLLVVWCLHGRSLFMGEATYSKPRNRKLEADSREALVRRELEAIIRFFIKGRVWLMPNPAFFILRSLNI